MKVVSVSDAYFKKCTFDKEVLFNIKNTDPVLKQRPYVLVVKLIYQGRRCDFVLPLRSNLNTHSPDYPVGTYFKLPTSKKTKPGNSHVIHYSKMCPITSQYLCKLHYDKDPYFQIHLLGFIKKHQKQIISEAQAFLSSYEQGTRVKYGTDIDALHKIFIK